MQARIQLWKALIFTLNNLIFFLYITFWYYHLITRISCIMAVFGITKRLWKYHFQPNIYCILSTWAGDLVCKIIISAYQSEGWMCLFSFSLTSLFFQAYCVTPRFLTYEKGLVRNKHTKRSKDISVFHLNSSKIHIFPNLLSVWSQNNNQIWEKSAY